MERIKLTKEEKQVLRLTKHYEQCPSTYPKKMFQACIYTLESKGLVRGCWSSEYEIVGAQLTNFGKLYMAVNPRLRNPIDLERITLAIASVSLALAIVAILIVGFKHLFN
ncbi:MAG: hypothetical protein IKL83_05545 [Muribaculaceae bacterium]|nr:hypothetical protein [Muribaculaceae bacterium]